MKTMDSKRLQQAQNFIDICRGSSLSTITRALQLQKHQYEYIAYILGCKPEFADIASKLINR